MEPLALAGFTVHGIDYQGHGQSEGLRGMIYSVHDIVDDCIAFYGSIRGKLNGLSQDPAAYVGPGMGEGIECASFFFWRGTRTAVLLSALLVGNHPGPTASGMASSFLSFAPCR